MNLLVKHDEYDWELYECGLAGFTLTSVDLDFKGYLSVLGRYMSDDKQILNRPDNLSDDQMKAIKWAQIMIVSGKATRDY